MQGRYYLAQSLLLSRQRQQQADEDRVEKEQLTQQLQTETAQRGQLTQQLQARSVENEQLTQQLQEELAQSEELQGQLQQQQSIAMLDAMTIGQLHAQQRQVLDSSFVCLHVLQS